MADAIAVTNTSPVIALVGIGELRLLDALFETVTGARAASRTTWRCVLSDAAHSPRGCLLDPGERAAIALAVSMPGTWILLDEFAARKVAGDLGLPVKGTLGVLVEAKRRGLVVAVRPLIERMLANGCRLAPELVAMVLSSVGE